MPRSAVQHPGLSRSCCITVHGVILFPILQLRQRKVPRDVPLVPEVNPGGETGETEAVKHLDLVFRLHIPDGESRPVTHHRVAAAEGERPCVVVVPSDRLALLPIAQFVTGVAAAALAVLVRDLVHLDPEQRLVVFRQAPEEPHVPPGVVGAFQLGECRGIPPVPEGLGVVALLEVPLGLPGGFIESDLVDPRYFSAANLKNRIESYIQMLEARRKGARVEVGA